MRSSTSSISSYFNVKLHHSEEDNDEVEVVVDEIRAIFNNERLLLVSSSVIASKLEQHGKNIRFGHPFIVNFTSLENCMDNR